MTSTKLADLRRDAEQILAPRSKYAPTDPPVYIGHEPAPDGPDTRLARAFLVAYVRDFILDEVAKLAIQVDATTFRPNPFRDDPTAENYAHAVNVARTAEWWRTLAVRLAKVRIAGLEAKERG